MGRFLGAVLRLRECSSGLEVSLRDGRQTNGGAPRSRFHEEVRAKMWICRGRAKQSNCLSDPFRRNVRRRVKLAYRVDAGRLDCDLHIRCHSSRIQPYDLYPIIFVFLLRGTGQPKNSRF